VFFVDGVVFEGCEERYVTNGPTYESLSTASNDNLSTLQTSSYRSNNTGASRRLSSGNSSPRNEGFTTLSAKGRAGELRSTLDYKKNDKYGTEPDKEGREFKLCEKTTLTVGEPRSFRVKGLKKTVCAKLISWILLPVVFNPGYFTSKRANATVLFEEKLSIPFQGKVATYRNDNPSEEEEEEEEEEEQEEVHEHDSSSYSESLPLPEKKKLLSVFCTRPNETADYLHVGIDSSFEISIVEVSNVEKYGANSFIETTVRLSLKNFSKATRWIAVLQETNVQNDSNGSVPTDLKQLVDVQRRSETHIKASWFCVNPEKKEHVSYSYCRKRSQV